MRPTKTFDKEQVKFNLAKIKKGGQTFEVIIDPDKIIEFKEKKKVETREILRYEKIFSDAKKGFLASEKDLKSIFGTSDPIQVGKNILDKGEIQFTQEYRDKIRKEKKKRIIDIITRNAIDPQTKLPHPKTRIEAAFEEANIKIDEIKDAESQVDDIVTDLRPIIPIKFSKKEIQIKIGPKHAPKAYSVVDRMAKIKFDNWQTDGSWVCNVEIPAGIQNEFFDKLNKLTHGEIESKVISE
ncbi:ribosome assembly factor SBDS [Candidatus Woesearchaeota archaeon]|nr:ribosome assembly factor SBDS [Candidatus Woesearchaeota archaeon]